MVMNAIMTGDKASHHRVQAMLIARNGVTQSWGNTGVEIKRQPYQQNIDLNKTPVFACVWRAAMKASAPHGRLSAATAG